MLSYHYGPGVVLLGWTAPGLQQTPTFLLEISNLQLSAQAGFWLQVASSDDGKQAILDTLADAVDVWLGWLHDDHNITAEDAQADEVSARDHAWRNFPRREAMAPAMADLFGEDVIDNYYKSMAGDQSIRC